MKNKVENNGEAEKKTPIERYQLLDKLLSEEKLTIEELRERIAEWNNGNKMTRRMMELDLNYISEKFSPIKTDNHKKYYERQGYTMFRTELSKQEQIILNAALDFFGQFGNDEALKRLSNLQKLAGNDCSEQESLILKINSCEKLNQKELVFKLLDYILNDKVLKLNYPPGRLDRNSNPVSVTVHPYMIREYNCRWFLIGHCETGAKEMNAGKWNGLNIKCFNIDHLQGEIEVAGDKRKPCDLKELEKKFDEVVGVTLALDKEPETIYFWVDDKEYMYVDGKPIHSSQEELKDITKIAELRDKFDIEDGGAIFKLNCKVNYELMRDMMQFNEHMMVLEPAHLRNKIIEEIGKVCDRYKIKGLNPETNAVINEKDQQILAAVKELFKAVNEK